MTIPLLVARIERLTWCTKNDTFVFDFKTLVTLAEDLKPTKQNILEISAMFYDPIGLTSPIILQFRLIFDKICTGKCDWDTELPSNFVTLWNELIEELKVLEGEPVSPHLHCKCGNKNIDLYKTDK